MTAPYYMFAPFDRHYDGGFGATAEAFDHAAETLSLSEKEKHASNAHLPLQFLYRHAIELYLKSIIIILTKRLAQHHNTQWTPLEIQTTKGLRPLFRAHNIGDLYRHFELTLNTNWQILKPMCRTDWSDIPAGLSGWIHTIERHDPAGTFHRYPTDRPSEIEKEKPSFRSVSPEDINNYMTGENPKGVGFVFLNENREIVEAFMSQEKPLKELSDALTKASDILSGAHIGMRMEFAGGW